MFFDDVKEISEIARKTGTAVFVVPKEAEVSIKNAIILTPDEKSTITIEQVRKVMERLSVRQTEELFILIRPAELLGLEAANALLKNLEEPGERVHFVLVTDTPSALLPTILSRASLYFLRSGLTMDISADERVKELAKRLMVAKGAELVDIADEISKKKEGVRSYALTVLGVAIEMLYKSYLITGKEVFLQKLPKFLAAYEGISRNGHVKLQIVANLC